MEWWWRSWDILRFNWWLMFSCRTSCASDKNATLYSYRAIPKKQARKWWRISSPRISEILGVAQGPPQILNITHIDSPVVDATYVTFEVKWRTDEQTWALFHDGLLYLHSQVLSGDEDFLAGFFFASWNLGKRLKDFERVNLPTKFNSFLVESEVYTSFACLDWIQRATFLVVGTISTDTDSWAPKGPQPPRGAVPFGQRSAAVCTEVPWHRGLGKPTMTLKH